jgi:uncharacterized protein
MPDTDQTERPQSRDAEEMNNQNDRAVAEGNETAAENASVGEQSRREDGRRRDNLTPEQRSAIGRKGGEAVSRNREHMASIGRKGGIAVSRDREHMANIGQKGGRS